MRSLMNRLSDIEKCPNCEIVLVTSKHGDKYNDVRICQPCRDKENNLEKYLESLSLDGFVQEVVNGRAEVGDAKNHSEALYEKYWQDMPYGTAKARDGDPYQWISEQLMSDYGHLIEECEEHA